MMADLKRWWTERSEREQWMLGALGAIAAAMLAWYLILVPLHAVTERAEARHARLASDLASARASAAALGDAAARPRASGAVRDIVNASASAAGLEFTSTRPADGGGVVVSVAAVRPTFLFGWIAALERDKGIVVTQLSAQRNNDQTVSAEVGFAGSGA